MLPDGFLYIFFLTSNLILERLSRRLGLILVFLFPHFLFVVGVERRCFFFSHFYYTTSVVVVVVVELCKWLYRLPIILFLSSSLLWGFFASWLSVLFFKRFIDEQQTKRGNNNNSFHNRYKYSWKKNEYKWYKVFIIKIFALIFQLLIENSYNKQ